MDGIGFFDNGKFVCTGKRKPIDALDALPLPDWEALELGLSLDAAKSSDNIVNYLFDYPRVYPLIASRSCPYQCTFCYHPLGNKYRQRSIDSIIEELSLAIPKYRINLVSIYDELFAYNEDRVFEFCRKFSELKKTVQWDVVWFCQLRVDRISSEMLKAMKEAGCYLVSFGFESYSDTILKSMKKKISPEQIHAALHMTFENNIGLQAGFIFGDVAETLETFNETMAFWKEHSWAAIFLHFIFPCPDSVLYRYCVEKGIISDKIDYIENHFFDQYNMTQMPVDDICYILTEITKARINHSPSSVPEQVDDTSLSVECPHCNKLNTYKNFNVLQENTELWLFPASLRYFNKLVQCRHCLKRFWAQSKRYKFLSKFIKVIYTPAFLKWYLRITQKKFKLFVQ